MLEKKKLKSRSHGVYLVSYRRTYVLKMYCPKLVILFNNYCIPITFNNLLKACFSNTEYLITIQTQIVKVYLLFRHEFLTFNILIAH